MAIIVAGHKNPDCDTITAAIAVADLLSKRGMEAVAVAQGPCTPDTEFVLKTFGLAAPAIETDATGKDIALVDTTELSQALDNLDKGKVVLVVDHHKLGDVTTSNPLEMWVWPVGCTGTVIKAMYEFYGIEIPKNIAGAIMLAILNDTVLFKSPTCTDADKKAVEALAKIAGVADYKALGMDMLKIKGSVEGIPAVDLMNRDYKDFNMGGKKVGIGQVEVLDLTLLDKIKPALVEECKKLQADGRHTVMLLLTDIMKEGSEILVVSQDGSLVENAFGAKLGGALNSMWVDGCMSRKKQVVPPMEKAFA
ncbi:MAG: manganese-dependent inorganic pyrophosphatase [Humidesulfovibrio sp.]|jgi:manganese-dependent inorganic pyrophosphatase|uniref:manganese-dependent inorganic pyrophosphatase n=1 Tax=Humidesulfovibrio sp. TaxID=2910988 RepID=UPI002732BD44|nr:manganese-dependent inorganic pyrophosphatase [Humidesulfovibrio sp.]MDP2848001.1 manganese-dependent inorganic pyrophosphatase [Humidesulfovibrio sp.]